MLKKASTHVLGSIYLHALAHPRRLHLICSSLASCRNMFVAESKVETHLSLVVRLRRGARGARGFQGAPVETRQCAHAL